MTRYKARLSVGDGDNLLTLEPSWAQDFQVQLASQRLHLRNNKYNAEKEVKEATVFRNVHAH